jgi:hypothetical protein
MPVGLVFDSGQGYDGRAYRDAMAAARARGVPVVVARRGMWWSSRDGVTIDVLAPSLPPSRRHRRRRERKQYRRPASLSGISRDLGKEIGPTSPGSPHMGLWFHDPDGYRWELSVQNGAHER